MLILQTIGCLAVLVVCLGCIAQAVGDLIYLLKGGNK